MGLERGRHASEPFLLCCQLAAGSDFAVLTRRRLLCICAPSQTAPPTLRWAVALEDLFNIRRRAPIALGCSHTAHVYGLCRELLNTWHVLDAAVNDDVCSRDSNNHHCGMRILPHLCVSRAASG